MVWFWGKIYLRLGSRGKGMQRERLGYLMGSFGLVIDALSRRIRELGGELCTSSPAERIVTKGNMVKGIWVGGQMRSLDAIIATIPSNSFLKLTPEMPRDYALKLREVRCQAAVCLTLATKKPLSRFYWLNISDLSIPFVGVIEHTNFIDKIHYGGKHIIYLSNYISPGSPLYRKDASALLEEYLPHLEKINPDFNPNWIEEYYLFSEEAGQPIVSTNYSNRIPDHRTPISGLYLANTTQIYPQDRGMNYSVRLGIEVAKLLTEDVSGYSER
jgi:protoporphyrinogen oxidase